eukprot:1159984-Pelagomonas_calceolata.AAC.6
MDGDGKYFVWKPLHQLTRPVIVVPESHALVRGARSNERLPHTHVHACEQDVSKGCATSHTCSYPIVEFSCALDKVPAEAWGKAAVVLRVADNANQNAQRANTRAII